MVHCYGEGGITAMRSSNGRVLALIFCIIAATAAPAEARMRIETGRDLHTACTVLAENALNPKSRRPPRRTTAASISPAISSRCAISVRTAHPKASTAQAMAIPMPVSISTVRAATTSSLPRSSEPATGIRRFSTARRCSSSRKLFPTIPHAEKGVISAAPTLCGSGSNSPLKT